MQQKDIFLIGIWDMGYKNIKNLTNIESNKLKNFDLENLDSFPKKDIPQLFRRFIEDY